MTTSRNGNIWGKIDEDRTSNKINYNKFPRSIAQDTIIQKFILQSLLWILLLWAELELSELQVSGSHGTFWKPLGQITEHKWWCKQDKHLEVCKQDKHLMESVDHWQNCIGTESEYVKIRLGLQQQKLETLTWTWNGLKGPGYEYVFVEAWIVAVRDVDNNFRDGEQGHGKKVVKHDS